jgi:DNA-binding CsgD family transcriptional regulator
MLLRVFGPDEEYPHRTILAYQSQEIHSLDDPLSPIALQARRQPAPAPGPPLQALIARLLVVASLGRPSVSPRQREVARLHLWGYTLAEVAQCLDIPVSTARSRWRSARRHLQRALGDLWAVEVADRPAEITSEQAQELFREEQQRCCYHPPRHCPRGKERCRKTGICPFTGTRVVG